MDLVHELVQIRELSITGISIATNNVNEMHADTAKIPALWSKFYSDYVTSLNSDANIYGVYYEYDSNAQGNYRVLAGSTSEARHCHTVIKEQIYIKPGSYLCFTATGAMPEAVISLWQQIWSYFADKQQSRYQRRFDTDFEHYVSDTEVKVYIGVEG